MVVITPVSRVEEARVECDLNCKVPRAAPSLLVIFACESSLFAVMCRRCVRRELRSFPGTVSIEHGMFFRNLGKG